MVLHVACSPQPVAFPSPPWYKRWVSAVGRLRGILFRLPRFTLGSWLIVLSGCPVLLIRFPRRWRLSCPYIARWCRLGARCLGLTVRASGEVPAPGSLVIANHQGYVDIVTVGGLFPCVFAARHDMRRWPMFGTLAAAGGTIFINREVKKAGFRGITQVSEALKDGSTVIGFPEGTSTDGQELLPFRNGLFEAAVQANAPVVPAAVRYLELDGEPITDATRHIVGWFRDEGFMPHMFELGSRRSVTAEVRFGEPIEPPHVDRRALAATAEAQMRALMGLPAERVKPIPADRLAFAEGRKHRR